MQDVTPTGKYVYTVINIERDDMTRDDLLIKLRVANFNVIWVDDTYYPPRDKYGYEYESLEQRAIFESVKNDLEDRIVCCGNICSKFSSLLQIATGHKFCSADVVEVLSRLPTYSKVGDALFIIW